MKYVMLIDGNDRRYPLVFPENLVHEEMAKETMRHMARVHGLVVYPISAGFVNFLPTILTHGKSETLGIGSKPYDAHYIALGESVASIPPEFVSDLYYKTMPETVLRSPM